MRTAPDMAQPWHLHTVCQRSPACRASFIDNWLIVVPGRSVDIGTTADGVIYMIALIGNPAACYVGSICCLIAKAAVFNSLACQFMLVASGASDPTLRVCCSAISRVRVGGRPRAEVQLLNVGTRVCASVLSLGRAPHDGTVVKLIVPHYH